jgi:hypothetical protein
VRGSQDESAENETDTSTDGGVTTEQNPGTSANDGGHGRPENRPAEGNPSEEQPRKSWSTDAANECAKRSTEHHAEWNVDAPMKSAGRKDLQ